jgi:hypothetical protein
MREIAIAGGGRESSRCLLVPREICTPGLPTLGRLPDHRCHLTHRHRVHGLALPDGGHMSRAPTSVRGQPARADSSHVRWGGRPTISRGFCSRLWSPSALHSARTSSSSAILTPCATPSGNRAASPVWGYALIEPQLCRNRLQPRVCKEAASDCLQGRALRSQGRLRRGPLPRYFPHVAAPSREPGVRTGQRVCRPWRSAAVVLA